MFKHIAFLTLGIVVALCITSYVNNLMTQYNQLNSVEKVFTEFWCASDAYDKSFQDNIDCYIITVL